MQYTLKNKHLAATIHSKGAELCRLTDANGIEYLWSADARYWPRHAPILFPFVGRVIEGTYTAHGQAYTTSQHGFARDKEFILTETTTDRLVFTLISDLDTKKLYPFDFVLRIIYTLNEQTLSIGYEVINSSDTPMPFKIGAHPGFMCPLFEGETMEDYYLEFESPENTFMMLLTPEGLFVHETAPFVGQTLPLSPKCFAKDALVFSNLTSQSISLCSSKHDKKIVVGFENFPFLGIWSPSTPSPFVCIEPWFGHADFIDDPKELTLKSDLVTLPAREIFTCAHTISIH